MQKGHHIIIKRLLLHHALKRRPTENKKNEIRPEKKSRFEYENSRPRTFHIALELYVYMANGDRECCPYVDTIFPSV